MLKVNKVVIHNFCQHEDLTVALQPGIFSITGVNGAGKSNFIRAIFFGLTGEVLGQEDKKDDLLRWGATEGYVELELRDNTHSFTVKRTIHNSKHRLSSTVYGTLTRKAEINEKLSELIGLDIRVLNQLVFIPQGKLAELLTQSHSERMRILNRLFGLDKADKLREVLQSFKARIPMYPSRDAEITEQRQTIETTRAIITQMQEERSGIAEKLTALQTNKPVFEAAVKAPVKEDINQQLANVANQLAKHQDLLMEKERRQADQPKPPAQIPQTEDIQKAQLLGQLGGYKENLAAAQARKAQLENAKPELKEQEVTQAELQAEERELKETQEQLRLMKAGVCDKCGQPYTATPDEIQVQEDKCKELQDRVNSITVAWGNYREAFTQYTAAMQTWTTEHARVEAEIKSLEATVSDIESKTAGFDLESYTKAQAELDEYNKSISQRQQLMNEINAEKVAVHSALEQQKTLKEQLAGAVDRAMIQQAQEVLTAISNFEKELIRLDGQIQANTAIVDMAAKQLEAYVKDAEYAEINTQATRILDKTREVLHYDNLPKAAARKILANLNKLLLKYLSLFHTPFTLQVNNEGDFRCSFPGKADASVSALSGGQRIVGALAARFAFMELLTYGCGLLVLDEPTAYLDAINRKALLDVLKEAGMHVKASGITVLVPTNEDSVAPSCTGNITI